MRVMYVDDEGDIREVVGLALSLDPEIEVNLVDSGEACLNRVASWKPDVILLDVMMPRMDGPATLSHLRQSDETKSIPVIFMTARAQPSEIETYLSIGARGVIKKPFDPITLAALVRQHID